MLLKEKIEYMSCIDPLEFMQLMIQHDHYFEDYMSCDGGSYYLDEELLQNILTEEYFDKNYSSHIKDGYTYEEYISERYETCKKQGVMMKRYALYDAGVGRFCRDEDENTGNIFTFEAKDFDEADALSWSITDRLIDNGSLTNEGTQLVQLGTLEEGFIPDEGFCMRARDAQNDGEEWE